MNDCRVLRWNISLYKYKQQCRTAAFNYVNFLCAKRIKKEQREALLLNNH